MYFSILVLKSPVLYVSERFLANKIPKVKRAITLKCENIKNARKNDSSPRYEPEIKVFPVQKSVIPTVMKSHRNKEFRNF